MKSVMLSIKPQYCELIASGKKTVEVRKTRPKLDVPFKCYIYCTNDFKNYNTKSKNNEFWVGKPINSISKGRFFGNGKVIGEFVCDKIVWVVSHPDIFAGHNLLHEHAIEAACLTINDVEKYSSGKDLYGWHISDLVIYDEPKELSEFIKPCNKTYDCCACKDWGGVYDGCKRETIKRPPQSWYYVEELI